MRDALLLPPLNRAGCTECRHNGTGGGLCRALPGAGRRTPGERHVGAWLPSGPSYRRRGKTALLMEALFPLLVALCTAILTRAWYLVPLLYFPVWEILRYPIEAAFSSGVAVRPMHRLNLEGMIPEEGATLIAVSTLLPGASQARKLGQHLEQLWRTNGHGSVKICVLADLKGAQSPTMRKIHPTLRRAGGRLSSLTAGTTADLF